MFTEESSNPHLCVTILAGGDSAERDVSLESGRNVAAALAARGHRTMLLDPHHNPLQDCPDATQIILPMLHGTGGEDGTVQNQLNELGLPWVGSSPEASRLTFNKITTRTVLQEAGLRVPSGVALNRRSSPSLIFEAARCVGFPLVVKPAEQGSSVGVTIVQSRGELENAVKEATRWGSRFLIEQFIAGREVTVPVIDGHVFPAVEIIPTGAWYDYNAKYIDQATQYRVSPNDLPNGLNDIALRACQSCEVSAISRVDFRIDHEGRCFILEINTIPGMTSHSLVPMSAAALGISMGELCEQVLLRRLGRLQTASWESSPRTSPMRAA